MTYELIGRGLFIFASIILTIAFGICSFCSTSYFKKQDGGKKRDISFLMRINVIGVVVGVVVSTIVFFTSVDYILTTIILCALLAVYLVVLTRFYNL